MLKVARLPNLSENAVVNSGSDSSSSSDTTFSMISVSKRTFGCESEQDYITVASTTVAHGRLMPALTIHTATL
eukprot:5887-Heterococcus_DN1.PRE.3